MTPGQVAWRAYKKIIDPDLPEEFLGREWGEIHPKWRQAWEAAAKATLDAQECVHPWVDVRFDYTMRAKCTKCGNDL